MDRKTIRLSEGELAELQAFTLTGGSLSIMRDGLVVTLVSPDQEDDPDAAS